MKIEPMPWQTERDPERALERIFETIATKWLITEESFEHPTKRKIVFWLNPNFNPQKVYPSEIQAEGSIT